MADYAWACKINRENQAAIISEHPKFDLDEFEKWLRDHKDGYFVRDPSSPFDCRYFSELTFYEFYLFMPGNQDALFRQIIKK